MSGFKVGDKLRCIREFIWSEYNIELLCGAVDTVKVIGYNGNVSFNGVDYWTQDRFELIEEKQND